MKFLKAIKNKNMLKKMFHIKKKKKKGKRKKNQVGRDCQIDLVQNILNIKV